MAVPSSADTPRRPRGRPAKISRDQIVAATRNVAPQDLSMQAVADALGVSRKALHYYVGDRQGLLSLVVTDRFEAQLSDVELPSHADWAAVMRSYARAFREGLIQIGVAIEHTTLQGAGATAALGLAERVIDVLLKAGFAAPDAQKALTAVAGIAQTAAQTALQAAAGQHDYGAETRAALDIATPEQYPALRTVLAGPAPTPSEQFEFELDVVIAGMATLTRAPSGRV